MILTRYTINGKGIFQALQLLFNEVDMSVADEQELFDAEEVFERDMEVPDVCTTQKTTSWFTENGVKEFKDALDTILYYADIYLEEKIKVEKRELEEQPLYQDYYQVVLAA